jgi:DNA-binding CsgD family transcriptional regulator
LTNNQLGLIAIEEQQYALAGSYLSDALEYMNNNNVEFGIAAVCNNIGILQIKQGQTDSAMVMLNRALLYNKKLEREYGMAEVYNNLANLSSMHQEYNIGLMYLDSAEHYIRSYKSTELLIDNLKYRTTIYAGLENYQMAYQQHVKYQYAYSVFVNHADIEKVIKACLRIKLGEKDDVIDAQLLEFQQKNKKKLWLITLILILFIITLSLGVIWLKDWNKKNEGNRLKIGQLEYELEYRKQEVSSLLTQLTSTKDAMRLISSTISKANDSDSDKQELREAISNMKTEIQTKKEITKLNQLLNQLHPSFFSKLKDNYPSLTESELEILGLVRMRLSTKEIAALKSSSYKAIEMGRYRARKKMNLPQNSQLSDYLDSYGCIEYNEVKAD